jgi:phage terminase large subunit GpA-like protein
MSKKDHNTDQYAVNFTRAERRVFQAREPLTVSQQADKYRIVSRGPWKGPWKTSNTEYARFPMDVFQVPWVRRVFMCWPPQSGKTQVAANCLCSLIDQDPDTAFYVMSAEKTLKRIARRQIIPMFRTHRRVSRLLSGQAAETNQLSVAFQNGMDLLLAWASSVSALASESARYMFFDEVDKYFPRINLSLGDQRTNAYQYTRKLWYFTSPADESAPITQLIRHDADLLYYYHPVCPFCGHSQRMLFQNIRWPKKIRDFRKIENQKLARYICDSCGVAWDDSVRDRAVRAGHWMAYHHDEGWPFTEVWPMDLREIPIRPENLAFHLSAWYSPFISLSECAGMFLRGLGDIEKHRIFCTEYEAHAWKQTIVTTTEDRILKAKVKSLEPQTVPDAAITLTCGIDVQKRGFWHVVRAWARDYSNWLIHYGFLSSWAEVEDLLFNSEYPRANGEGSLRIWRAGLDTGGGKYQEEMSSAEEVYFWIIKNRGRGVPIWPTKGSSSPLQNKINIGKALERAPSGRALPGGLQVIRIDTDKMKDIFHFRLEKAVEDGGGPMAAWLHNQTGRDYARQILAEQKEIGKNGLAAYVQRHRENHLLDCEVIAHALADPEWPGGGVHLVIPRETPDADENKQKRDRRDDPDGARAGNWLETGYRRPAWLGD